MIVESQHLIGQELGIVFKPDKHGVNIEITEHDKENDMNIVIKAGYVPKQQFDNLVKSLINIQKEIN